MKKIENVLYTDGHDVTVTDSGFQVKKRWYQLSGITKHNFMILTPDRFPCVILLLLGAILEIVGAASVIPASWMGSVHIFNIWLQPSMLAMGIGILLLLIGTVWMWLTKERYAVSITTAEGEKNVVVSERKEYIMQIIHALNEALFARISNPDKDKKREFMVSHR